MLESLESKKEVNRVLGCVSPIDQLWVELCMFQKDMLKSLTPRTCKCNVICKQHLHRFN